MEELCEEIKEELTDSMRWVRERLKDALEDRFALEDYYPPRFDEMSDVNRSVRSELHVMQSVARKTRESLDQSLKFGHTGYFNKSAVHARTPNVSLGTPPDLEDEATIMDYLQPEMPLIFLPRILVSVFFLFVSHRWLVEAVIQCMRAWQLYRRFQQTVTPAPPRIVYHNGNGGAHVFGNSLCNATDDSKALHDALDGFRINSPAVCCSGGYALVTTR